MNGNPNIDHLLQTWTLQGEALASLDLSADNARRRDQILLTARGAAEALAATRAAVEADPELSPTGKANRIAAAERKAAQAIPGIRSLLNHIAADFRKLTEIPPPQGSGDARVDEQKRAELRAVMDKLDPLEVRARCLSEASQGRAEVTHAVLAAPPEAFPRLASALDEGTRRAIGLELRTHYNPDARRTAEDLSMLLDSLNAVADDLGRTVGEAGDPIARMAAEGQAA